MPQIRLLDGKKIDFQKSINGFDLTKKISKSLEKIALIMEVDGDLKDLSHQISALKVRLLFAYFWGLENEVIEMKQHLDWQASLIYYSLSLAHACFSD